MWGGGTGKDIGVHIPSFLSCSGFPHVALCTTLKMEEERIAEIFACVCRYIWRHIPEDSVFFFTIHR